MSAFQSLKVFVCRLDLPVGGIQQLRNLREILIADFLHKPRNLRPKQLVQLIMGKRDGLLLIDTQLNLMGQSFCSAYRSMVFLPQEG